MLFAAAIHDLEHTGKYSKYESFHESSMSADSPKALIHRNSRSAESADSSKEPIRSDRWVENLEGPKNF